MRKCIGKFSHSIPTWIFFRNLVSPNFLPEIDPQLIVMMLCHHRFKISTKCRSQISLCLWRLLCKLKLSSLSEPHSWALLLSTKSLFPWAYMIYFLLPKVWCTDQHHEHHLGVCMLWKLSFHPSPAGSDCILAGSQVSLTNVIVSAMGALWRGKDSEEYEPHLCSARNKMRWF